MRNSQTPTYNRPTRVEANATDSMSSAPEARSATANQSQLVGSSSSQSARQGTQDSVPPVLPPRTTTVPNCQFQNVTFAQKKAMLEFIMAHRELALSDSLNEHLWKQLTTRLNTLPSEGIRTCEEWKQIWMVWSAKYKNRRNDLSITLLDLKFITFLESLTDKEKKKTELKHFALNIRNSVKASDLLSMITSEPVLAGNEELIRLIDLLRYAEQMEEAYQTKADFHKNTLDDLMLKKEELDKNIESTSKCLLKYQKDSFSSNHEKHQLLEKIRDYVKQLI